MNRDPIPVWAESPLPPIVCVVGYKDTGKTGIAVRLVRELRRRGYRVGAVKHAHGFQIDHPRTDSWRLTHEGGADPVLLTGPEGFALLGEWDEGGEPHLEDLVRRHFADRDVIVAEGFKRDSFPKIEVHRRGHHTTLVYESSGPLRDTFIALVTDADDLDVPLPTFASHAPDTIARLAEMVAERVIEPAGCAERCVMRMEGEDDHPSNE